MNLKHLAIRVLIAAVCVVAVYALTPLLLNVIGFSMDSNIEQIFKIVVLIVALYYVVWGPAPVPS
jgi:hypothetical protein